MGPITLFDKSFLEMLNVDEAAIFDLLFSTNICPIYYVEVLADLQKAKPGIRLPEKIVADLARKTPVMESRPNVHHVTLCRMELAGLTEVEMRYVPVVAGGRPVQMGGKPGSIFDEAPEAKAFRRWEAQEFDELEREFVAAWRADLERMDLGAFAKITKDALRITESPKTLEQALRIAIETVEGEGQRYRVLLTACETLNLNSRERKLVVERWKGNGRPRVPEFAPYTAHCLRVEVFFHLCLEKKLISPDRPSNLTDMAYLNYLPFAMIFISNDKLHARTAPLFMTGDQQFVTGAEMKADLAKLDEFYSATPPDEMKERGMFNIASRPPDDNKYLTTQLWNRFMRPQEATRKLTSEQERKIVEKLKEMKEMATARVDRLAKPENMIYERKVPATRGKWQLLPDRVINRPNR